MSTQAHRATLQRRPLVKQLLDGAEDNLLVIAGLGTSNWDITAAGDRPLNMPLWGSMGAPVGMGLGLAVCTTIVEAHRGRLWASNNAGPGATLHLELPTSPQ